MKIVLLKGHSSRDGGAQMAAGEHKGRSEYAMACLYVNQVADRLRALGHKVYVTSREAAGGITPAYAAAAANMTDAELAVEFHFNSATRTSAGTETLCWYKSRKGEAAAKIAQETLCEWLGNRDRGVVYCAPDKATAKAWEKQGKRATTRGYNYFSKSRAVALLFEPDFAGSNPDAAIKFGEAVKNGIYADACADAIHKAGFAINS